MSETFTINRNERDEIGELYRRLKKESDGRIEVILLDPRNFLAITAYFSSHWRKKHITMGQMIDAILLKQKRGAVFFDGRHIGECSRHTIDGLAQTILQGGVKDGQ